MPCWAEFLVTLTELQSVDAGDTASQFSQFTVARTEAAGDRSCLITSPVGCFGSAGAWPCWSHHPGDFLTPELVGIKLWKRSPFLKLPSDVKHTCFYYFTP